MDSVVPALKKGDLIYITAPAKAIEQHFVDVAREILVEHGYQVLVSEHCTGSFNYFSGTDAERLADLQYGIDHPEVKAILCARGGYGCVRLVDQLGWAAMLREPKWLIGFSDVTVFHQHLQKNNIPSIHATMPLNFEENTPEAFGTLFQALEGIPYTINCPTTVYNKPGMATGKLLGGNLSILYSLLGTNDQPDYSGAVLFIEDLAEQLYHVDRMMYAFSKAGILNKISGLIVGGMTGMRDTETPFGQSLEEIILAHFRYRNIPVAFNFPAGHISDNRALKLGEMCTFRVNEDEVSLSFL